MSLLITSDITFVNVPFNSAQKSTVIVFIDLRHKNRLVKKAMMNDLNLLLIK